MATVLFVCLQNAGRSQMSAALFEREAGGRHRARSAGTTPAEHVHPEVVQVMRELGIDLAGREPQLLTRQLADEADLVVTMGCGDACPYIPGKRYVDWDLPDPAGQGPAEVSALRDEIAGRVKALVRELDAPAGAPDQPSRRRRATIRAVAGDAEDAIKRMDHVGIVVEDLAEAVAFFLALGLELRGETSVEGDWAGRIIGLDGVRAQVAMLQTPDGHAGIELSQFTTPSSDRGVERAPADAPGIRHVAFAVRDIDDVLARLEARGGELVGELGRYRDIYRLCYVRGPAGIIVELAERIGEQAAAPVAAEDSR